MLARFLERGGHVRLVSDDASIELPSAILKLLAQCVRSLEQNQAVTLLPPGRLLSLEEAADVLGVPRANAHRLLTQEELPVTRVDGEPRILADHLLTYYSRQATRRQQALAELVDIGQEIDPEPAPEPTGTAR